MNPTCAEEDAAMAVEERGIEEDLAAQHAAGEAEQAEEPCNELKPRDQRIEEAYRELRAARRHLHDISEVEFRTREILKRKEAELLLSGAIIGKNTETRDAQLKEATKMECQHCEDMRKQKGWAQLRMDIAVMTVPELQLLVRNDQAIADLDARGYVQ